MMARNNWQLVALATVLAIALVTTAALPVVTQGVDARDGGPTEDRDVVVQSHGYTECPWYMHYWCEQGPPITPPGGGCDCTDLPAARTLG